jgi:antirestriction protein ArdC
MPYKKYPSRPKRDHYQEVTDQIVAALEQGIIPWRRTWNQGASGVPMNCTTGRFYRGINQLLLGLAQAIRFGDDPRWCSYRQAQARGWQVRSGERGRVIVFYKRILKNRFLGEISGRFDGVFRRIILSASGRGSSASKHQSKVFFV